MTNLTPMVRGLWLAVGLLLAALLLAGFAARHHVSRLQAELTVAQADAAAARRALKKTNAALTVRTKALNRAQAQAAAARKEVHVALQANPGWADAPVPDAVWDGLYGPAAAAGDAAAPAP